ncbi:MAG: VTT domain-containing protein [Pseudomonadota bacterium]
MSLLHWFIDLVLHLDKHLVELLVRYDLWVYAILFVVIFAETGFVVTPMLPGDSLLFAAGALAAIDAGGKLQVLALWVLLALAAILGNTLNYTIGRAIGNHASGQRYRFVKATHLQRTEAYFRRHGAPTVLLSRFAPILRTFAPFIAGIARMPYGRFQAYNVLGGILWVGLFVGGGFLFGNLPAVKDHFGIVTISIILTSLLPMLLMIFNERRQRAADLTRTRGTT